MSCLAVSHSFDFGIRDFQNQDFRKYDHILNRKLVISFGHQFNFDFDYSHHYNYPMGSLSRQVHLHLRLANSECFQYH